MPTLDIDMFDDSPKVGDKIKVMGKVKSIDEETGDVTVSYDDVSIVKKQKKRNRDNDDDNDFDDDDETEIFVDNQMEPNVQTYDQALARAFPNTQ